MTDKTKAATPKPKKRRERQIPLPAAIEESIVNASAASGITQKKIREIVRAHTDAQVAKVFEGLDVVELVRKKLESDFARLKGISS